MFIADWVSACTKLPEYGQPVIVFTGVVQNTTFMLDASEEEEFGWWECVSDGSITIPFHDVKYWHPMPAGPV